MCIARVPMLSSRRTSWSPKDHTRVLIRPSTGSSIPSRVPALNLSQANNKDNHTNGTAATNTSGGTLPSNGSSGGSGGGGGGGGSGERRHRHTMLTPRSLARAVESENMANVRAVMRMYMTELDLNPVDEVKIKRYLGDPSVLPSSEKAKAAARIAEARASLSAPERYEAIATEIYHQQQNARQSAAVKSAKLSWLMGLHCSSSAMGGHAFARNPLFDTALLSLILEHLNQVEEIDLGALRSTIHTFIR